MFFQAKLTFLITGPLCQVTDNETESNNQVSNQNYWSTLLADAHFVTAHGGVSKCKLQSFCSAQTINSPGKRQATPTTYG